LPEIDQLEDMHTSAMQVITTVGRNSPSIPNLLRRESRQTIKISALI